MIWIAWVNGSLYIELHGRQDGRTRLFVFVQMAILALLAVFTGRRRGRCRRAVRADLRRLPRGDGLALAVRPRAVTARNSCRITGAYSLLMAVSIVVVVASAFLPPDATPRRLGRLRGRVARGIKLLGARSRMFEFGVRPTDSMVERFGLFTIIVLGEVVIGVVAGLSAAEQDPRTFATGAARARHRLRLLVDVLRRRGPAAATSRGRGGRDVDARPLPDHSGDRRVGRRRWSPSSSTPMTRRRRPRRRGCCRAPPRSVWRARPHGHGLDDSGRLGVATGR